MKRSIITFCLLAVAACGGQTSSTSGTGFSTGAGKPQAKAVAVAPGSRHDRLVASVKPKVLARMETAEPVKAYSGTVASVSAGELAKLTPRAQDAIVAILPEPSFWTGYAKSHVHFRAGLVGGSVARARVNGQDFAHMISGTFLSNNREQIYALIAHRSGCKWNGKAAVVSRDYPGSPKKLPTWFVGLSC